jgi:4a-hydroxytetrahydrobiopterin dehydratase
MARLLDSEEVSSQLSDLTGWTQDGDEILADFEFDDFGAAMVFVNRVAEIAEENNHHPDIDIRWNKVHLAVSSHDAGGLTQNDIELARRINAGE